ncbi:MAG: aspartate--tRNA ligase [Clostridiales bacterium]|nr:aspartate--tRNA ligase [Clostridiales bacterium]
MMDSMTGLKRTNYCGDLRTSDIGKEVVVCGWVAKQRDLGSLIFIDLRDRQGVIQLAFDENVVDKQNFEKAFSVRSEYVLMARGKVRERASKNKDIPTGEIEIEVEDLRVLAKSQTPPFEIVENSQTGEATRLKHRYLDLRRPDLQSNLLLRHKIVKITRDYFDQQGFIEIETPMLIKSTPEGARDFLVPSRLHQGTFYALPQSPQLYKQISMVAGFDKYMQIARCFRDEDLRADRQPEFTQIDLEMSFVDMEDVLEVVEGYVKTVFKDGIGVDISTPLPRLTYKDAMSRYGSDKPDTRFDMELYDLTQIVKDSGFGVFKSAVDGGGCVCGITAKDAIKTLSRKEIDKLTDFVKGIGGKGIAWIRMTPDSTTSSFGKFVSEEEMQNILNTANAQVGDAVLIIGDTNKSKVLSMLGALRLEVAKKLDIIPKDKFNFLWITEFPFFDYDEEMGEFVAMHHPFTAPMDDCLQYLETDKSKVNAKAYDLVLNGVELSSGSIRITDPELQNKMFTLLGLSQEEAQAKFGYLLEAFKYGAPPHGGMGIGLDRLIMQMVGCETLRDVVAYPKLQNATEPMTQCPSVVDDVQLEELGLKIAKSEK